MLDLDETLVHSSFKPGRADHVIPVQIEQVTHNIYVRKRPGVDKFLLEMAELYEIVIYTASLAKYANPLLDLLDPADTIRHRLYRGDCTIHQGNYVKDLSTMGRPLQSTIIVDNSPGSYLFHPENAIAIGTWIDDDDDVELHDLGSFLATLSSEDTKDVRMYAPFWAPGIVDKAQL